MMNEFPLIKAMKKSIKEDKKVLLRPSFIVLMMIVAVAGVKVFGSSVLQRVTTVVKKGCFSF